VGAWDKRWWEEHSRRRGGGKWEKYGELCNIAHYSAIKKGQEPASGKFKPPVPPPTSSPPIYNDGKCSFM